MHIYGAIASPFVQRVLMAARAKGHELDLRPPPGGMQSGEFQAISPMGRIPILEDGDWRLCESDAIAGYLDEALDGPGLLPDDYRARAHARQIVSLAMCELAGGLRPLMMVRVFRAVSEPALAEAGMAQAVKGLDAIEKVIDPAHRWAAGDAISVADCILVPVLALMTIIGPMAGTAELLAARPKLAAYYERAGRDPIAGRTIGEMTEAFGAILARMKAQAEAAA